MARRAPDLKGVLSNQSISEEADASTCDIGLYNVLEDSSEVFPQQDRDQHHSLLYLPNLGIMNSNLLQTATDGPDLVMQTQDLDIAAFTPFNLCGAGLSTNGKAGASAIMTQYSKLSVQMLTIISR